LARLGSGSAARACFGGWVSLETNGEARQAASGEALPMEVVACLLEAGSKAIGSGAAMARARETSPLYEDWLATARRDMDEALDALIRCDLEALFACSERNTARMHALLARCATPIDYATSRTRQALRLLEEARSSFDAPMAVTRDAGPNPFVFVPAGEAERLRARIEAPLQALGGRVVVLQAGEAPYVWERDSGA
jgi:diphosphomevalonate decarboxylase